MLVDGVEIPFDNYWNFAISLSGGADSALLAFLLSSAANKSQTIHVINHIRMWKTRPWQQYDALRVYNHLTETFSDLTYVYHNNFIAPELEYGNVGPTLTDEYKKKVSGDNIQQRAYAEFICHKYNLDAYYNAVTRNPRQAHFSGMRERDLERSEDNKHLEYMVHMNKIASHPFRFVDKAWIVKQYKSLGIMDLFNKTRSCEGEFENLNYETYEPNQEVPICGQCFWCKEREWAISNA